MSSNNNDINIKINTTSDLKGVEDLRAKLKEVADLQVAQAITKISSAIESFSGIITGAVSPVEAFKSAFTAIGEYAGPFGAAIAGTANAILGLGEAFAELTIHAGEAQKKIDLIANSSGLSPSTVATLKVAAESIGASYLQLITSVDRAAEGITGDNKKVAEGIEKLGLSIEALRALSPDESYKLILKSLNALPPGYEKAAIGAEIFGVRASKVALQASQNFDAIEKSVKDSGLVLSGEGVDGLRKYNQAALELGVTTDGLRNIVGSLAAPAFTELAKAATEALKSLKNDPAFIQGILDTITVVRSFIGALGDLKTTYDKITNAFSVKIGESFISLKDVILVLPAAFKLYEERVRAVDQANKEAKNTLDIYNNTLREGKGAVNDQIEANRALLHAEEELQAARKITIADLESFNKALRDSAKEDIASTNEKIEFIKLTVTNEKEAAAQIIQVRADLAQRLRFLAESEVEDAKKGIEEGKLGLKELDKATQDSLKLRTEALKLEATNRKEIQKTADDAEKQASKDHVKSLEVELKAYEDNERKKVEATKKAEQEKLQAIKDRIDAAKEAEGITEALIDQQTAKEEIAHNERLSQLTNEHAIAAENATFKIIQIDAEIAKIKERQAHIKDENISEEDQIKLATELLQLAGQRATAEGQVAKAVAALGPIAGTVGNSFGSATEAISHAADTADQFYQGLVSGNASALASIASANDAAANAAIQRGRQLLKEQEAQRLANEKFAQDSADELLKIQQDLFTGEAKAAQAEADSERKLEKDRRKERKDFEKTQKDDLTDLNNDLAKLQSDYDTKIAAEDKATKQQAIERERQFQNEKRDTIDAARLASLDATISGITEESNLKKAARDAQAAADKDPTNTGLSDAAKTAAGNLSKFQNKELERQQNEKDRAAALDKARIESKSKEEFDLKKAAINAQFDQLNSSIDAEQQLKDNGDTEALKKLNDAIAAEQVIRAAALAADLADLAASIAEKAQQEADARQKELDALNQAKTDRQTAYDNQKQQEETNHQDRLKDLDRREKQIKKQYIAALGELEQAAKDNAQAIADKIGIIKGQYADLFSAIKTGSADAFQALLDLFNQKLGTGATPSNNQNFTNPTANQNFQQPTNTNPGASSGSGGISSGPNFSANISVAPNFANPFNTPKPPPPAPPGAGGANSGSNTNQNDPGGHHQEKGLATIDDDTDSTAQRIAARLIAFYNDNAPNNDVAKYLGKRLKKGAITGEQATQLQNAYLEIKNPDDFSDAVFEILGIEATGKGSAKQAGAPTQINTGQRGTGGKSGGGKENDPDRPPKQGNKPPVIRAPQPKRAPGSNARPQQDTDFGGLNQTDKDLANRLNLGNPEDFTPQPAVPVSLANSVQNSFVVNANKAFTPENLKDIGAISGKMLDAYHNGPEYKNKILSIVNEAARIANNNTLSPSERF